MSDLWVDAPEMRLDLRAQPRERYRLIEPDFWSTGRQFARVLRATLPPAPPDLSMIHAFRLVDLFQPEAHALAEHLFLLPDEVMIANMSYDLALSSILCSAAATAGPEGPALGRNLDWWPQREMARASSLLRFEREGSPAFWIAGWPGSIGAISGMSARGFALILNAAFCEEAAPVGASPVMLLLRRVLEDAADYADALERLSTEPLAASAIIMLVGRTNAQRVVIERTPTRRALRRPIGDEPLVATNCFLKLPQSPYHGKRSELLRTARRRYDALGDRLLADPCAGWSDEGMLAALSDPGVRMRITAQQMVFRPGEGRVRLVSPEELVRAPRSQTDRAFGAAPN